MFGVLVLKRTYVHAFQFGIPYRQVTISIEASNNRVYDNKCTIATCGNHQLTLSVSGNVGQSSFPSTNTNTCSFKHRFIVSIEGNNNK